MDRCGGGGFCDCGDTEAWKEGPYCQKHKLSNSEVVEEEVRTPTVDLARMRVFPEGPKLMLSIFVCCLPPYFLRQGLMIIEPQEILSPPQ